MSEYIDREALLKHLEETVPDNDWLVSQFNADWIYSFIESPLAADVAPREEVERIKREIFECLEPSFAIGEFTGSDVFYAIRAEDYNRCKKKYTEDGK